MNVYELIFLLNKEGELKNIKGIIAADDGQVIAEESWGTKTLKYPIKKQVSATFYSWQIQLDGAKLSNIKNKLNLNENLIRYLFLKVDEREVAKKAKAPKVEVATVKQAPAKIETKATDAPATKVKAAPKTVATVSKSTKVTKKTVSKAKK